MSTPDTPADSHGQSRTPQPDDETAAGDAGAAQTGKRSASGEPGAEQARTIASGSAQTARSARPVITGTAAARILGRDTGGPVTGAAGGPGAAGMTPSDRAAAQRAQQNQPPARKPAPAQQAGDATGSASGSTPARSGGKGIDAPTSHIDRSHVPDGQMPDLGSVRQPAGAQPQKDQQQQQQQHTARPRVTPGVRRSRGPLRASMQLRAVDPWSALKVSFIVSIAIFLVWMVAVAIIYVVLDGMGVWDRLNSGVTDIISDPENAADLIGPGQVFGVAAILGVINIVLFTALCTLGAFVYNLTSDMVGGVEVTLADRD